MNDEPTDNTEMPLTTFIIWNYHLFVLSKQWIVLFKWFYVCVSLQTTF